MQFLQEVGHRVAAETGEPWSLHLLLQRVSVAIQRGTAACITCTVCQDCSWDNIFICRPSDTEKVSSQWLLCMNFLINLTSNCLEVYCSANNC
jgi:hypothetical protein